LRITRRVAENGVVRHVGVAENPPHFPRNYSGNTNTGPGAHSKMVSSGESDNAAKK